MKIIIDTDKQTIEIPKQVVKTARELGRKTNIAIIDMANINEYRIIERETEVNPNRIVDKTTAKMIDDYMNKIKESDSSLYEEYIKIKNEVVGKTKNGKEKKNSFLNVKNWFYANFPKESPFYKKESN